MERLIDYAWAKYAQGTLSAFEMRLFFGWLKIGGLGDGITLFLRGNLQWD